MKLNIAYVTVLIAAIMIPSAFAEIITTEINDTAYEIDYMANNVILKSATSDLEAISIFFETEVIDSDGNVTITFERDFFDAKIGTEIDDDFWVLADGEEIKFEETKNDESRILSFSISAGTEEIEIIGTILAGYSFLMEQQQAKNSAAQAQSDAEAAAQARADAEAAAQADAQAAAQAEAQAEAQAQADTDAKNAEEQKLEKLMNSCGDGTIFENGECILSNMEKNANNVNYGPLIYSVVIAMMIGIVIILILWGIGKKSHKTLSEDGS